MIRKILVMLLLATSVVCSAQIQNPVKWSFTSRSTGVGEAELVLTATIEKGWHLYSQFIEEGGPVPTSFKFEKSADYELVGKVKETSTVIKAFEKAFNMNIAYFANKAVFVQKIQLKKAQVAVKGSVEFMECDDEQCLPPDEHPFTISVKDDKVAAAATEKNAPDAEVTAAATDSAPKSAVAADTVAADTAKASVADTTKVASATSKNSQGDKLSLWAIFLAGLGGGFAAFFMPCIFPMVPFTVSFSTKKSSNRSQGIVKALIYALSIIVIYVGLGLLITI